MTGLTSQGAAVREEGGKREGEGRGGGEWDSLWGQPAINVIDGMETLLTAWCNVVVMPAGVPWGGRGGGGLTWWGQTL